MSALTRQQISVPAIPGPVDHAERWIFDHGGAIRKLGGDVEGCTLTHRFTPGLYTRELFLPAGSVATSMIHRTEHPFVVSKGRYLVYVEGEGWKMLRAPHTGITLPGTRRVFIVLADTVLTTFHPTDLTDIEQIERELYEDYENPLLGDAA